MFPMPTLALFLPTIFVAVVIGLLWPPRKTAPYFTGPRGWPLIGNLLPAQNLYLTLSSYADQYGMHNLLNNSGYKFIFNVNSTGPIYSLRVLRTPIVVLNTAASAKELLEAKSSTYWSRPVPIMVKL